MIISGSTLEHEQFRLVLLGGTGGCADILDLCDAINAAACDSVTPITDKSPRPQPIEFVPVRSFQRTANSRVKVECILDDGLVNARVREVDGVPVLGGFRDIWKMDRTCFFITAIGNVNNFRQRVAKIQNLGLSLERFITLIHPSCSVSSSAHIGLGCVIHYNSFLGRNTWVGDWSVLLPGTILSHDSRIGAGCIVNAGVNIAGDTTVGDSCYLGGGSLLRDHLFIADRTLIGMGSVVVHSVAEVATNVYGNPARTIDS